MASHRLVKIKLMIFWSIFYFVCDSHLNPAQAFLYHQLQPVSSTSYYNVSRHSEISNHPNNRQATTNRVHQGHIQNQAKEFSPQHEDSNEDSRASPGGCPVECHCNKEAQIADCSNRNLFRVPNSFPKDIKRIRLERNNITELGPYAFKGLKRLQRIDLSNNNLVKIDSLAFSGGLQALNSLILYSNKLNQLPVNVFSELSQLQLLLLNANSLQCINKELFQSLSNLNLLSLYDNNIETLANGTFDGLKNIKTIHLGKNPLICDCNLRWLADYLELNPIETSEAGCASPARNQAKKLSQLSKQKFKCEGNEQVKTNQIADECAALSAELQSQSCPPGCDCNGTTIDCSKSSQSESRNGIYELPDIPEDVPVFVARMRINDSKIKRIRQSGLFRRLANSQKLDLGNNKIIDIEDNAINGALGNQKPERVVFVLLENESCGVSSSSLKSQANEDPCSAAPRVNSPTFDSPCYNGGSCKSAPGQSIFNYSCLCPPGFAGPLCEINIDDCIDHRCQNEAACVDGVNSYKCVCREPTTTGEFCEQLNPTSSANSIAPIALPMIASGSGHQLELHQQSSPAQSHNQQNQQILARSADFSRAPDDLPRGPICKRVTQRQYYYDGNGCRSVRLLKMSECAGPCGNSGSGQGCCVPAKVKRKRIRMQCSDGASYVKVVDLIKKCACSNVCASDTQQQIAFANSYNATQEDQLLQITRLDAVD